MTERNSGKAAGPPPELHAVGTFGEPVALDPAGVVAAHRVIGLQGPGKGTALFSGLISVAGQHVTDLTTVPVGARLRVDHPNHMSTQLTVIGAYGKRGKPASDGLLCHVDAPHRGDGWDTVLTPWEAENAAVWLLSTPTSEGDCDGGYACSAAAHIEGGFASEGGDTDA